MLAAWGARKSLWGMIIQMSKILVLKCVVCEDVVCEARKKPAHQCDKKHENGLLRNQYTLFYEEMVWAMNAGDIDHIEAYFIPRIECSWQQEKKYAHHMMQFLWDLHTLYLPSL